MAESTDSRSALQDTGTRPRLWPAVAVVAVHLCITFGTILRATTNIHYMVGIIIAPLLAALLLMIWWLAASRVPFRERLIGFVLMAAVVAWVALSQKSNGFILLLAALPVLTTAVVAFLAATGWMRWPVRRWGAVAVMVVCAVVFTGLRADGLDGNLLPMISLRLSPTSEQLLASAGRQSTPGSLEAVDMPQQASEGDWPGFRGPVRDGRATGIAFSANWDETPPREMWRRRVGLGWSSFTVIGEYLFTQEQRGGEELVVCYRAGDGNEVWRSGVSARFEEPMGPGPRGTPAFDRGKLYTQGATGVLLCLDAVAGSLLWQRDLTKDVGAKTPTWGFSSSPVVAGNTVITYAGAGKGKSVAAYDAESGELLWSAGEGGHGYSSGHLARIADVPQVLMSSNYGLQAFEPETGSILWEHAWDYGGQARIVQPLLPDANSVILGTGTGLGTRSLGVAKEGAVWKVEEQWTTRRFRPYFNDLVYHEGHCYGFDGNRLACMDAATGERLWRGPRHGGQVLLIAEMGMLLVLNEAGEVVLVQAAPDEYHEIAKFKAIDGKTWNHPVVAHGRLFVRNSDEAACFELPAA